MPKFSLDMPGELLADLREHVGDERKFVSVADAVRTACRKLLDQLDAIDARHGRLPAAIQEEARTIPIEELVGATGGDPPPVEHVTELLAGSCRRLDELASLRAARAAELADEEA